MSNAPQKNKTKARDAPKQNGVGYVISSGMWEELFCSGYKPLTSCPEVQMAIGVYADLIANMTIQLMQNTDIGDVRIKNGLSRKLDIEPQRNMTHQTFMSNLVRVMLTEGNQVTVPIYTRDGLLDELRPLPPQSVRKPRLPRWTGTVSLLRSVSPFSYLYSFRQQSCKP